MKKEKKRLGDMLVEAKVINGMQLNAALGQQRQWGGKLGSVLIAMGFVSERSIVSVLEEQLGTKCVSLEGMEISQKALNAVKIGIAKKYCIMPLDLDKNTLSIAISDPTDVRIIDELSFLLGLRIKPALAIESDIKKAIAIHYEGATHLANVSKPVITKMPDTMQIISTELPPAPEKQTSEAIQIEPGITFSPEEMTGKRAEIKAETKTPLSKDIIDAVTTLLIEKGIFTKEELLKKIKERSQKS